MKKTQLYPIHHQLSDKIIDFHGWQLPVQYSSIIEEHLAVRRGCGVFDISHMGLIKISGLDLIHFLDYLTPSNIRSISPGQCIYTLLLNEQGGIIDDVIINLHSAKDAVIVINASNRKKDMDWIKKKNESYSQGTKKQLLELKLISDNHSFLAVQGPRSFEILAKTLPDLALINNFSQTHLFAF